MPDFIRRAFRAWVATVELIGIREARKLKGYHDEPLHGDRLGQRSIRLSKAYRVIYVETIEGIKVTAVEISKHGY